MFKLNARVWGGTQHVVVLCPQMAPQAALFSHMFMNVVFEIEL